MRAVSLAMLVGCAAPARGSAPASATAPAAAPTCDVTLAAGSARRARLRGATTPVVVVDVARTTIQIAMVSPEVIVTRWVPLDALEPVTRDEVAVSPGPRAAADPALRVRPGFPLADVTTPWIPVRAEGSIAFAGFVPAGAKARIWEEAPRDPRAVAIHATFDVHAAASSTSPILARLGPGARVRVRGSLSQPWISVVATTDQVRVEGFVARPPPAPVEVEDGQTSEMLDLPIEGAGTAWLAPGTCLWDAPGGAIVGAVHGPLFARPRFAEGWSAVTVTSPWGQATYFAHAPVVEPAAAPEFDWSSEMKWGGERRVTPEPIGQPVD